MGGRYVRSRSAVAGAEFEAGEVFEELGAIAFEIVLRQIPLVRAGQDSGQFLQGEQFRVERIDEGVHGLLQIGALDVIVSPGQHGPFFGANQD